jgi:1-aminocyclopropane-1-carboxylate deaminase/D-cysteine desulfhydrase-like pyridoxal-dependent ACC family enzyme
MPNFTKAMRSTRPDGAGPNAWIKRDENVLFIHTGGASSLHA